jgi:cytoskeletal protein CcmA (bactofilin family)
MLVFFLGKRYHSAPITQVNNLIVWAEIAKQSCRDRLPPSIFDKKVVGCYRPSCPGTGESTGMVWFDRNPGGKKSVETEPEKVLETAATPTPPVPEPTPVVAPETKIEPIVPAPVETGVVGHLYKGSRVTGQLIFQGAAKIDGNVEGEIRCSGTLTIGEGAEIRAKVTGQTVVIRGRVEGNVTAKEKVELLAPARLHGNIASPRLIITEGVVFDGDCSMGVTKPKIAATGSQSAGAEKAVAAQAPKLKPDSEL